MYIFTVVPKQACLFHAYGAIDRSDHDATSTRGPQDAPWTRDEAGTLSCCVLQCVGVEGHCVSARGAEGRAALAVHCPGVGWVPMHMGGAVAWEPWGGHQGCGKPLMECEVIGKPVAGVVAGSRRLHLP